MEDNEMKTIAYNPQREILTILLTLILSFSLLTTLKAQGNSNPPSGSDVKTTMNEVKAVNLPNTSLTENETGTNLLGMKIKWWMDSGSYWDRTSDVESIIGELTYNIKKWLSDGSFWSPNSNNGKDIDQSALADKDELTYDALYTSDK